MKDNIEVLGFGFIVDACISKLRSNFVHAGNMLGGTKIFLEEQT